MRNPRPKVDKPARVSVLVRILPDTLASLGEAAEEFEMSRNDYITFWLDKLADIHRRGHLGDQLLDLLDAERTASHPYDSSKMSGAEKRRKRR